MKLLITVGDCTVQIEDSVRSKLLAVANTMGEALKSDPNTETVGAALAAAKITGGAD